MKAKQPDNIKNTINHTITCVAKGDTGATSHYWMKQNSSILKNKQKVKGISVQLPDKSTIQSSETGELPLPSSLSTKAKTAIVLPHLKSANLISLGQLCDDDCQILLNKNRCWLSKITN